MEEKERGRKEKEKERDREHLPVVRFANRRHVVHEVPSDLVGDARVGKSYEGKRWRVK